MACTSSCVMPIAAVAAKISPVVRLPSKRMKAERWRELKLP